MEAFSFIAYTLAVAVVLAFGLGACAYAAHREKLQGGPDSPDFFLTARRSVKTSMVAWSFFASAMGSWALFGPPSYCLTAGATGTLVYALCAGLPVLLVACVGAAVHRLVPNVVSMADYVRRRFGLPFAVYISLLAVGNMGVAMAAEYTALGDLFHRLLHAPRLPIVMLVALTAMLYTAAGGLYVSIVTDQWQALASLLFTALLTAHVLLNFPSPLPPLPPTLGWSNPRGVEAVLFMPLSLLATTLFNEAFWQRCWASASPAALLWGAALGAGAITVVVGLLGFAGLLAAWSGVYEPEGPHDSGNTILFSLFRGQPWALVAVALLAVTMSESAVDSLQNATVDAVAALLLAHPSCSASSNQRVQGKEGGQGSVQRHEEARVTQVKCTKCCEAEGAAREASPCIHPSTHLHCTPLLPSSLPAACPCLTAPTTMHPPPAPSATDFDPDPVSTAPDPPHHGTALSISSIRALVLILNIPPLLVSLQGFNVLQLFLLVNLVNTTSFLPLLLGVLQGPLSRVCITPASSAAGCASGLLALVVWAKSQQRPGETYVESLARTFLDAYDYPPYLIAVGFSGVGMAVGAGVEWVIRWYWRLEYPAYYLGDGKGTEFEESRSLLGN